MDEAEILKSVKTIIGITDENQDELLLVLINLVSNQLKLLIDESEIPDAMIFVVTEVSVIRYNRRKNEGMTSYSQDGESISFAKSDFDSYLSLIDQYKGKTRTGEVWGY